MISASELESMRATAEEALPDTCVIRRATVTPDGLGGQTRSVATVATVPCRLSPANQARGNDTAVGGVNATIAPWNVTVAEGTDVLVSDEILIGARVFRVIEVVARSWELVRRVYCEEIDG